MARFFVDDIDGNIDEVNITGDDFVHIRKVLRLVPGDEIIVCDGNANDYTVRISGFSSNSVRGEIIGRKVNKAEPPIYITLFQGIPKSDKMEIIIQKCTELGVYEMVPVINMRTVVKIDDERDVLKKSLRWNRIATDAAKQCNRGRIPIVKTPVSYKQALGMLDDFDLCLIPYEKEESCKLKDTMNKSGVAVKKIAVFVGPEGGFDEEEIKMALHNKVLPVSLGPRILRTETAGFTLMSILMYALGDMG